MTMPRWSFLWWWILNLLLELSYWKRFKVIKRNFQDLVLSDRWNIYRMMMWDKHNLLKSLRWFVVEQDKLHHCLHRANLWHDKGHRYRQTISSLAQREKKKWAITFLWCCASNLRGSIEQGNTPLQYLAHFLNPR